MQKISNKQPDIAQYIYAQQSLITLRLRSKMAKQRYSSTFGIGKQLIVSENSLLVSGVV